MCAPYAAVCSWPDPQRSIPPWQSLTALIWPRTAGSAGAFWNYNPDMQLSASGHYNDVIEAHNSRLIARGVDSCPNGCTCDWGHKCGKPYGQVPPLPLKIQVCVVRDPHDYRGWDVTGSGAYRL